MKRFIFASIAGIFLMTQVFSGVALAELDKIAYVDVAQVFDNYQRTKDHDQVLRDMGKKKEEERDALVHDIRRLKDEIALMSDDAAAKKRDQMDQKVQELQQFDVNTKRELGEQRNKIVREIFQDIDDVVKRYGERKGYDMILNERVLLYQNAKYDITEDVIKELNKDYKKKK